MEVEALDHTFFHCRAIVLLCKFKRKIFVLEVNSVCNNVVPPLTKGENSVRLLARSFESRDLNDTSEGIL